MRLCTCFYAICHNGSYAGFINFCLTFSFHVFIAHITSLSIPSLLYGIRCDEMWVVRRHNETQIQAAEMKFLQSVKGCTRRGHISNDNIREGLNILSVNCKIDDYRNKWYTHVMRMDENRIPKLAMCYAPSGRRSTGCPRKSWMPEQVGRPNPRG